MIKTILVAIVLFGVLTQAQIISADEIPAGRLSANWRSIFFVNTDSSLWTLSAEPIKLMDSVQTVASSNRHSFVIKTDGTLWAWGDASHGKLGSGELTNEGEITTPIKVLDSVSHVVTGNWHTMAIKTDGSLWGCGDNSRGQLGLGDLIGRPVFTKIMNDVKSVAIYSFFTDSIGADFTLAVKRDGSLWAFGDNWTGMFGNGKSGGDIYSYDADIDSNIPIKIMDNVKSVAMKSNRCYIIKTDNSLWDLNPSEDNSWKALGTPPVMILDNVAFVTPSEAHTLAIKTDGSLWAWGRNQSGEIGDGTQSYYPSGGAAYAGAEAVLADKESPVRIIDNMIDAAAGFGMSAALDTDGALWMWGDCYLSLVNRPVKVISPYYLPEIITGQDIKIVFTIGSTAFIRNGAALPLSEAPYLSADGRAMVPLRFIAQELGAIVQWNYTDRAAVVKSADKVFNISLDNPLPDNMGQALLRDQRDGRMLVPVRYLAENLGAEVVWDSVGRTITIYKSF